MRDYGVTKFEVEELKINALRSILPYGVYLCQDGREVLFNRGYNPIWERKDGCVAPVNQGTWIQHTHQAWFFDDTCSPFRENVKGSKSNSDSLKRCIAVLKAFKVFRVRELVILKCDDKNITTTSFYPISEFYIDEPVRQYKDTEQEV